MSFVIINPGTGPVDGAREREARRNIGAFCRELAFRDPIIRIKRCHDNDDDGRYGFTLTRGIRETVVDMPGLPLDRVRMGNGDNAWNFPRLYVDGNSWLWPYAISMARDDLRDHDGSAERAYEQSRADCDFVWEHEPRCPTCGSIKERYLDDSRKVNPPYGYARMRCVVCVPITTVIMKTWDKSAVFGDDSWKHQGLGCVWRVTQQMMPAEALDTEDDPRCHGRYPNQWCRLKRNHDGWCKGRWDVLKEERIEMPYRGDGT